MKPGLRVLRMWAKPRSGTCEPRSLVSVDRNSMWALSIFVEPEWKEVPTRLRIGLARPQTLDVRQLWLLWAICTRMVWECRAMRARREYSSEKQPRKTISVSARELAAERLMRHQSDIPLKRHKR